MIHANVVYNKNTKEINVLFENTKIENYQTKIFEVMVLNTNVVNKKAIARCNQAINYAAMSMYNHQRRLMWRVNPQGILSNKKETIRVIRICDANQSIKDRNIIVTYSKPPQGRLSYYKKNNIDIDENDVFINVSYMYNARCVHQFRYVEGARLQGLTLRQHYVNFLNKNKESLTAKGFNDLALAVLPELDYVSVDPVTLEADDILSEYF